MVRKIENKSARMIEVEEEWGIEIEELLRWAYVDQNYSSSEISTYLSIRRTTINKWLKLAGIYRGKVALSE